MAWVYYSNNIEEIERANFSLDFISKSDLAVLLFKPQSFYFSEKEITLLLNAFSSFNCVLWSISAVNSCSSLEIQDKKRAFGEYKKLSKNVFLKREHFIGTNKYYSDLSILNLSEVSEGRIFFAEHMFGQQSTFAFVKNLDLDYANFEILVDIYLKHRYSEKFTNFTSKYIKFKLANYVNNITSLGGIATLVVQDTETFRSIILLSQEQTTLQKAFTKLQCEDDFFILKEEKLTYFIKRLTGLSVFI